MPGVGWRASSGRRLADALEALPARSLQRFTGLAAAPAGAAAGEPGGRRLVEIADFSLRELDPDTVAALFALLGAGTMSFLRERGG